MPVSHSDTEHIAEQALNLYVVEPAALDPAERDHMKQHLGGCGLCRERLAAIETFQADFMKSLEEGPTDRDRAVARTLASEERARWLALPERAFSGVRERDALVKSRRTFVEIVDPFHNGLVGRVLEHFRIHPVRAVAGGMAFVAAIVALSLFVVRGPSDTNPVRFFVKDRLLSVLNKEGRVLWTRHVPGVSDGADEEFNSPTQSDNRLIGIGDIDGKGMNVVLIRATSSFAQDSLHCIEGDGTLRWSAWAREPIRFGKHESTKHAQMGIYGFQVTHAAAGAPPSLYVVAQSTQYFPSKLMKLDPQTGRELESYWHPGGIEKLAILDVDGDQREEIVIGGFNQLYGMAFVALLEQTGLRGCGPLPDDARPSGMVPGGEKYYLLFPQSDLGKIQSPVPFNSVRGIVRGARPYFQVYVDEGVADSGQASPTLVYTLDSTMNIVAVATGNTFEKLYDGYLHQGKLTRPRDRSYKDELAKAVLYWDGEQFVRHHAMNRRYAGAQTLLP
jgi:hypothetical protein